MYQYVTNPKSRVANRKSSTAMVLVVMALVTIGSLANFAAAADAKAQPPITLAQLQGPWSVSLFGQTGCGLGTELYTFTLNAAGQGSATMVTHAQCGDFTQTSIPVTIKSLNANGSGTAGFSCGSGCGWSFVIQVAKNKQSFSLVDATDPSNYLQGVAVHQ